MQTRKPLISIIVPHLNQPEELEHCLRSLESQTLDRDLFEVVVVDNGSSTLPEAVVRRYPRTRLSQELKPGPGLARNRGVRETTGDILAFIDADCRANPDWLEKALRALNSLPTHTILGGDVRIWRDDDQAFSAIEAYESVFAYRFKLYIEQHGFSGTGNLVVRRSDFDHIGPFRGIQIAEDIDWGERACASGCIFCFVQDMTVFHPARKSLGELCVKWDRHIQHALNKARGKPNWRIRWVGRAFAVLASPGLDWTKVVSSERVSGLSPRIKAIFLLLAIRTYRAGRMISLLLSNKGVAWNRADAN
jgi:GT2 family glycosyltransferase